MTPLAIVDAQSSLSQAATNINIAITALVVFFLLFVAIGVLRMLFYGSHG
ncbi:MAG: hypothetical protein ACT4PT_08425 [Methanobacteriota archaeon]